MSVASRAVLIKYWGYSNFRPLQEEIVDQILEGNDILALLPTGGGKSICFQVPAMVMEGICIVVTPLIALMKDQVQNLKKVGIPAAAIYSGMHPSEIDIVYNQSIYGRLKFLYVSPERLATTTFIEAIKQMKVNLLAIDESHCISQWGYDFRPPYLRISEIRPYLPKVPVLALTATATKEVVEDIQEKLLFKKKNVFQTSFERKNVTYNVVHEVDKNQLLLRLAKKMTSGSGIVYVRNRKRTRAISEWLTLQGISSTFYHAGLDTPTRDKRQEQWKRGVYKIIVATNAFGMGIDKPDVRLVVHMDLPDTIEAYFQEAGRAGRDLKDSSAYLIVAQEDVKSLKSNFEQTYPEQRQLKAIYQAIGNYLQIPIGSGKDQSYDFDMVAFSKNYNFNLVEVFNALKLFEKEGIVALSESFHTPSKIFIKADRSDLYRFQVEQPDFDLLIKFLLRNFPGILTDFVTINEEQVALKLNTKTDQITAQLNKLQQLQFLVYIPRNDKPQLILISERLDVNSLYFSKENYHDRKKIAAKHLQSVIDFVYNDHVCRSIQLLAYFNEKTNVRCGRCDVCIKRNKLNINDMEFKSVKTILISKLVERPYPIFETIELFDNMDEEKVLDAIQWMLDNEMIMKDQNGYLHTKSKQLEI